MLTFKLAKALRVAAPKPLGAGALALLVILAGWAGAVNAAAPVPAELRQSLAGQQPGIDDGGQVMIDEDGPSGVVSRGARLFATDFTPEQGLGPLYNARSCVACHSTPAAGGMGNDGLGVVLRVGRLNGGAFEALDGQGGPVSRAHSIAELGYACSAHAGIPAAANLTSVRNAPALFGLGLVDAIPDDVIRAGATPGGDGVRGRPSLVIDANGQERVGRFGWKADTATLQQFVAGAFRNELGITSPLAPYDFATSPSADATDCATTTTEPEDDGTLVDAVTAYIASLDPMYNQPDVTVSAGPALFHSTGCTTCHTPSLRTPDQDVPLYSDLLLHDLGSILDDGVIQGTATGRDWRTTPLWGLHTRTRFLHDGRARTIQAAVTAHGGEADSAVRHFRDLSPEERALLLAFLASL
jgi:CxxC motif-containing protein (DUF1111 family)